MHGRDMIPTFAFHPDGKHILSGGDEGDIRQWDDEDGHEVGDVMVARRSISVMGISRNVRRIVSVGRLRRPFGGLLLGQFRDGGIEYKYLATNSSIIAQAHEEADLELILDNVRTFDVLYSCRCSL